MSTVVVDEEKTWNKIESAGAAEEVYESRGRHGRFRIDQAFQAAGCDDESEPGLCCDAKTASTRI